MPRWSSGRWVTEVDAHGGSPGEPRLFRHEVLTRFGVRFTAEQRPPSEEWLRYRLGFFE